MNRRGPPSMPRELGIDGLQTQGPRLVKTRGVRAAIDARVATAAMAANEVLARIADVATSDLLNFIDIDPNGGWKVDLKLVKRLGLGHLIKRLRINKDGTSEHRARSQGARPAQAWRPLQPLER